MKLKRSKAGPRSET